MKKLPFISIVIPLYVINDRFFKDLHYFMQLTYKHYEIIIVTDSNNKIRINNPKIKVISTNQSKTGPAEKRDIAMNIAKGEIIAFIDDDAYPEKNWLTIAVKHFNNPDIVAVGGPGITPKEDSYVSQISGLVYESLVTSGKAQHRFVSNNKNVRNVNDWPAYNLLVRTNTLKKINGYGCTFYGGEDTFLCLKLIKHGKIIYDPSVIVFHHRRPIFTSHLRQIFNVGIHRGYFFKKFPETSRQLFYTLPSIFTVGFFTVLFLSLVYSNLRIYFSITFLIFYTIAFISIVNRTSILSALIAAFVIILTHISYGFGFIKGILTNNLLR